MHHVIRYRKGSNAVELHNYTHKWLTKGSAFIVSIIVVKKRNPGGNFLWFFLWLYNLVLTNYLFCKITEFGQNTWHLGQIWPIFLNSANILQIRQIFYQFGQFRPYIFLRQFTLKIRYYWVIWPKNRLFGNSAMVTLGITYSVVLVWPWGGGGVLEGRWGAKYF